MVLVTPRGTLLQPLLAAERLDLMQELFLC